MYTYMPANSIFDGPITNLLSILCILVKVLSCAHANRGKSRNNFKFGASIGRFPSDSAESTAVKELCLIHFKLKAIHSFKMLSQSC